MGGGRGFNVRLLEHRLRGPLGDPRHRLHTRRPSWGLGQFQGYLTVCFFLFPSPSLNLTVRIAKAKAWRHPTENTCCYKDSYIKRGCGSWPGLELCRRDVSPGHTGEPGSTCLFFALVLTFCLLPCQLAAMCPPLPATLPVSLVLLAVGTRPWYQRPRAIAVRKAASSPADLQKWKLNPREML